MANDKSDDKSVKPVFKSNDRLKGQKTLKVNNFLNEFEKDDVKRYVDIVDLFHHFGVKLTKSGNRYKGICPWHNDKNPSLSVDRENGLFNCFGCEAGGDIFDLTEKMKNIDFKEALKYLKSLKGISSNTNTSSNEAKPTPVTPRPVFPGEGPGVRAFPLVIYEINLNTIADYYHKRLYAPAGETGTTNGAAADPIDYLKQRGIKNLTLYERFKIGYSDGSILDVTGPKHTEFLKEVGILNESNGRHYEQFNNCVVFPIIDEAGYVLSFYGREISLRQSQGGAFPHRYLKGKHRGVFNRKASMVYDEIILTESIIDALSLIELGVENVQSIYGTNGFTDEHLYFLKGDRVKTVVLAFDSDAAGEKAAEAIQEKLLAENFIVKVINPSWVAHITEGDRVESVAPSADSPGQPLSLSIKDWNEYLLSGCTGDAVKSAITIAPSRKPEVNESTHAGNTFKAHPIDSGYEFTCGDIVYRVSGVKDSFISTLKVNIKATTQTPPSPGTPGEGPGVRALPGMKSDETYYDNLDLYSARSRTTYSQNLSRAFNTEPRRIEKDLIIMLEYLEKDRDKRLLPEKSDEVPEINEADRALGMVFLTSENMFDEIISDMDLIGYVGEDLNKQLLYIAASTRKLDDPISVLITSQSASGKSMLVDTVKELLPPEDVIAVTSLSDQALNYAGDLVHKFLTLSEAVHNEVIEHQLREMLSAKELSRLVTIKDDKTGKMKTHTVKTKAVVSTVMSTTNHAINPENASRSFLIDTDESCEQTKRIHKAQRDKYSLERHRVKTKIIPEIIRKHHAAQRLLHKVVIVNPFARHIRFPVALMRTRRDHERFLDLIAGVCFLRQYQKEVKRSNTIEFIECDLIDYAKAHAIMVGSVLGSTMNEPPQGAVTLYDTIRSMARELAKERDITPTEVTFIQRDVREQTQLGAEFVKKHIRMLVEFEYLHVVSGRNRGTRVSYRLRADEPLERFDAKMIPTPEEIEKLIQENSPPGPLSSVE